MPSKKYYTDLENIYTIEELKTSIIVRITNDEMQYIIASENLGNIYITPIKALAVNILKRTNILLENTVFPEVDPCLLCREDFYLPWEFLPFKEFILASCRYIYHQKCLEKHLVSKEAICPNKKCNKVIETFLSPKLLKGSQDKPTTSIAEDTATKQVDSENPTSIGEDANTNYINELGLLNREDGSFKTTKVTKETSDQATSPIERSTLVEQGLNDAQKKCSRKDSEGINWLLSNVESIPGGSLKETNDMVLNTRGIFLQLSVKIDSAESKNKDTSHALISSYFDFGEALFNQYKELKPIYGKEGARALVKSKVRKEISKTNLSEDALQKRIERV
ncbi:ATP dependent DNA helicase [Gigaspora margarita]|uniref:ATP dependent DNA helicase n=1 Tax=Gigaspora margarita TaxID=4874 RepID=A0A8H3XFH3_GIGMA|nr:ATP dependent DNA helicase [Gigaspora margarita]